MEKIYKVIRDSETYLDSVENETGEWLGANFPSNTEIEAIPFTIEVKAGKKPTQDLLGSFANDIVVSKRFKDLICNLSLPDFVRCIPVTILHKKKRNKEKYFVLHEYDRYFDIAHQEHSIPQYAGKVLVDYEKLVVSREKCPNFDFFPAKPAQWLCSEEVLRLANRNKLTGVAFKEFLIK